MTLTLSLLTLLHLLIPIYWLGGDLGAFYSSTFMTDPRRTVSERMLALKILNNIDMAPRTTLILAYPTGLALAAAKGWVEVPAWAPWLVAAASLVWLAIAWTLHLRHGRSGGLKAIDLAIRYIVLAWLLVVGTGGMIGLVALPLFLALKLFCFAGCIALGLLVRRQLVPLFGAIGAMRAHGPTPETDAIIAAVNGRARVSVLGIWALVLTACFLGIAKPL